MAAVQSVTRHGAHGYSAIPYGSFAGKAAQATVLTEIAFNTAYEVYIKSSNGVWEHTQIVFTGNDFGEV